MAIFLSDLIRTTRRGRAVLLRAAYALVLLVALGVMYANRFPGGLEPDRWFANPVKSSRATEVFAGDFATVCLIVQFAAAVLLTPAVAAGAIAEERQRGTFDFLIATDLSAKSIVLGKFAARWLAVVGLLITGYPVVALTQLWGGMPWQLLAFGTAITLLTTLSLTGLGILCSVRPRSVRTAMIAAYAAAAGLAGCSAVVSFLRFGDPWYVSGEFMLHGIFGGARSPWIVLLAGYATWHGAVCILSLVWATWLVRPQPLSKVERNLLAKAYDRLPAGSRVRVFIAPHLLVGAPAPWADEPWSHTRRNRQFPVPPIGHDPLLWKELHFGGPAVLGELTQLVSFGVIAGGLAVGLVAVFLAVIGTLSVQRAEAMRTYDPLARDVSMALLAVIMIGAALRSAATVGRERDRQTLDSLLVLPARRDAILRAKWVGSALRTRWLITALAAVLVVGVLAGNMEPAVVLWLLLAGAVHVGFVVSLGLFFSVVCRGAARATVLTLLLLAAIWLLPQFAVNPRIVRSGESPWVAGLLADGLSPPATWRFLASPVGSHRLAARDAALPGVLAGLAIYASAAWLLWHAALTEFRRRAS